jgi:uncharacterized membrane protein HdeD (DUF308 family)
MAKHLAHKWWSVALRGAIAVMFGLIALGSPGITIAVIMILFGAYAAGDGALALYSAWRAHDLRVRWWGLLFEGMAGIALGMIAMFWPATTATAFVYLVSAWAMLTGLFEIGTAIALRRELEGEWALATGGAASLALGLFLAARPAAGAIGIVWLLGAYSIVFGILVLTLAFRLRRWGRTDDEDTLHRPHPV